MTIYKDDIKLMASQRMTDTPDGGGRMTGNEIISGEHNTIFPDISDIDRAYGVVNIMSCHLSVQSTDTDDYRGANIGLIETPEDDKVEITLMSVNNPYQYREDAKEIIERFLVKGVRYQGELLYTQLEGQRAIRIIQRTTIKPPVAGEVLTLVNTEDPDNVIEQYVKIENVEVENQPFFYSPTNSEFTRSVVTCIITEPLRHDFIGIIPTPSDTANSGSAVYETMVADASRYFGTKPLRDNADFGSNIVTVPDVYNHLVPSARIDTAHINQSSVDMVEIAVDAGNGNIVNIPTAVESLLIEITAENQGYVYTATLVPIPNAGTVLVSYMVQGKWYELKDQGDGTLKGANSAYGSGQIDALGNLMITTGALPDVDSPILIQWATANSYIELISGIETEPTVDLNLSQNMNYKNATISWLDKTATIVDGVVSGDATGKTIGAKLIELNLDVIPANGTDFVIEWGALTISEADQIKNTSQLTVSLTAGTSGNVALQLPPSLVQNRIQILLTANPSDTTHTLNNRHFRAEDISIVDKDGFLYVRGFSQIEENKIGTVDYVTGVAEIIPVFKAQFTKRNYYIADVQKAGVTLITVARLSHLSQEVINTLALTVGGSASVIVYTVEAGAEIGVVGAGTETVKIETVSANIATLNKAIIDSSVNFEYNGKALTVSGSDVLDNAVKVGSMDDRGNISLTEWSAGNGDFILKSGLLESGISHQSQFIAFKTAGNPVASRSLQVNARDHSGGILNGTTDADGNITGDGFQGEINTKIGVVVLAGSVMLDSANIFYNCVSYNYLPLDADQLGLDPIRLPSDGRVVIYRKGDTVVISEDKEIIQTVSISETVNLADVRLTELSCNLTHTADLDAGTITFTEAGEAVINYRIEDIALVSDVDISGRLRLSSYLSHAYSADKAKVASIILAGNLWAHYTNLFDQKTWTGEWSDNLIGDDSDAQFNDVDYPLVMMNKGSITEEWAIIFTSSTNFKLIGKNIGQIAVGDINTPFEPNNPNTSTPYFTIPYLGWGAGWSTGNALRFKTLGANFQFNVIRTILQGQAENPLDSDKFALQLRGNINKEVA